MLATEQNLSCISSFMRSLHQFKLEVGGKVGTISPAELLSESRVRQKDQELIFSLVL